MYAHWQKKEITITFDANGGSVSTTTKQVTPGNTYGQLPTPTLSTYTFDGWYTDRTNGTKKTQSSTVDTETNHTLYARWYCSGTGAGTCTTSSCSGGSYDCTTCYGSGKVRVKCSITTTKCSTCSGTGSTQCTNWNYGVTENGQCPTCGWANTYTVYSCLYCGASYSDCSREECPAHRKLHDYPKHGSRSCPDCKGSGSVPYCSKHGEGSCIGSYLVDCTACSATGKGPWHDCSHGYSGSHNYCNHFNYTDLSTHTYCVHGKTSKHTN